MRCFVSIDLPTAVRDELNNIIRYIKSESLVDAKFVEKYNLHLTLKFLGEINEETITRINDKLQTIQLPSFAVTLGKLGIFTQQNPRVLWVSIDGSGIFSLVKAIENCLSNIVPRETKLFALHITIARIKKVLDNNFYAFLENYKIEPINFVVSNFCLKKSELTSDGPIYSDIACYQL